MKWEKLTRTVGTVTLVVVGGRLASRAILTLEKVVTDVLIPGAKNMFVDAVTKGLEKMVYGDTNQLNRRVYGSTRKPRMSYGRQPIFEKKEEVM